MTLLSFFNDQKERNSAQDFAHMNYLKLNKVFYEEEGD
jgi:hypothetical protein